jgi:ubiquinone/menaquinone biosynthesis C-methylase UbiE
MVHHDVCPLCSSEKIALHLSCNDHFISRKDFAIFNCSDCGFLFTQDYPEETEIGQYYESGNYISHSNTSEGFSNKLYRVARVIMLRRKKRLIGKITHLNRGTILDIGSGTGYFASTMKRAGWQTRGIEINEKARSFSITNFELEVDPPERITAYESNSFDCITLWHVLEHFHDPFRYISEIYRLLKPGGVCIVALPNSSSLDAKSYKQFWAAWDVPRHLWHFQPVTFRIFAEKSGFILENLKILPLDVFYISLLSERYKGSGMVFFKAMSKASFFSFMSVFNRNRSSSVIYILRKL